MNSKGPPPRPVGNAVGGGCGGPGPVPGPGAGQMMRLGTNVPPVCCYGQLVDYSIFVPNNGRGNASYCDERQSNNNNCCCPDPCACSWNNNPCPRGSGGGGKEKKEKKKKGKGKKGKGKKGKKSKKMSLEFIGSSDSSYEDDSDDSSSDGYDSSSSDASSHCPKSRKKHEVAEAEVNTILSTSRRHKGVTAQMSLERVNLEKETSAQQKIEKQKMAALEKELEGKLYEAKTPRVSKTPSPISITKMKIETIPGVEIKKEKKSKAGKVQDPNSHRRSRSRSRSQSRSRSPSYSREREGPKDENSESFIPPPPAQQKHAHLKSAKGPSKIAGIVQQPWRQSGPISNIPHPHPHKGQKMSEASSASSSSHYTEREVKKEPKARGRGRRGHVHGHDQELVEMEEHSKRRTLTVQEDHGVSKKLSMQFVFVDEKKKMEEEYEVENLEIANIDPRDHAHRTGTPYYEANYPIREPKFGHSSTNRRASTPHSSRREYLNDVVNPPPPYNTREKSNVGITDEDSDGVDSGSLLRSSNSGKSIEWVNYEVSHSSVTNNTNSTRRDSSSKSARTKIDQSSVFSKKHAKTH